MNWRDEEERRAKTGEDDTPGGPSPIFWVVLGWLVLLAVIGLLVWWR